MKHVVYLLGALLLLSSSQKKRELQREFVIERDAEDYSILPAGKDGLIMTYSTDGESRKTKNWNFELYDSDFQKKWTKNLVLDDDFSLVKSAMSNDNVLHILMSHEKYSEYYYITLDPANGQLDHFGGRLPIKAKTQHFQLVGDRAVFGGNAVYSSSQNTLASCLACTCVGLFLYDPLRDHATLNYVDYKAKSAKPVVINYRGQTTLNDLTINENDATFVAVLEVFSSRYKSELHLLNYDENGKEQSRIPLDSDAENISLLDGFTVTDNEEQFVVGTYASKSYSAGAEGLYFTSVKNGKQYATKHYDLSDFEEFWGNYGSKMTARIQKRVNRRKRRGAAGIKLRILPNKIEKRGNEILYVGEAYYIEYRTESYYDAATDRWVNRSVFDGYYFTHGIVAGFDLDGRLLWQDSYPLLHKTYTLKPQAKIFPDEASDDLLLVSRSGNTLRTQAIRGRNLEVRGQSIELLPDEKYEKFRTGELYFDHWYENYFVAYGIMYVKDKDEKFGRRKKTIFYFRRIEYE